MKKGVSPIIGIVILISICFVLAAGVFMWVKGYTFKIGGEYSDEALCRDVVLAVGDVCYEDSGLDMKIKFNVLNNAEDLTLHGFRIFLEYEGGSQSILTISPDELQGFNSEEFATDFITIPRIMKQLSIIPRIKSGNDFVDCEEEETIVVWEEVGEC